MCCTSFALFIKKHLLRLVSHFHTHTFTPTPRTPTLSHPHFHTQTFKSTLSHPHFHTHTFTPTLSHPYFHTHAFTSFTPTLSQELLVEAKSLHPNYDNYDKGYHQAIMRRLRRKYLASQEDPPRELENIFYGCQICKGATFRSLLLDLNVVQEVIARCNMRCCCNRLHSLAIHSHTHLNQTLNCSDSSFIFKIVIGISKFVL